MMGWHGGGMSDGAWLFMGLFWLMLLALIVWLVARLLPSSSGESGKLDSPEEILDRRFARGELDTETYQAQRAALVAARTGRR
jgi:putative membrane protein